MEKRRAECTPAGFILCLLVFVCFLSEGFAEGAVRYVTQKGAGLRDGSSWANACNEETFPVLLSEAVPETEFWVARGRYRPDTGGRQDRSFNLPAGVALYGGFSGFENSLEQRDPEVNVTVLTGDLGLNDTVNSDGVTERIENIAGLNSHLVLLCEGGPAPGPIPERYQSLIDGLVITAAQGATLLEGGGGTALLMENADVLIRRCLFIGNQASWWASAVRSMNSNILISECTFSFNEVFTGGGLKCTGPENRMIVRDCVFSFNRAGMEGGGGIYNHSGNISVSRCTFRNNSAGPSGSGGGMYNYGGKIEVEACTFSGNSAEYGGAIANLSGADFSEEGDGAAENCTFFGNSAVSGGSLINQGRLSLRNCTLYENSAEYGDDLFARQGSTTLAVNCIFWNGYAGEQIYNEQSDILGITYSIIRGGFPGDGNRTSDHLLGTPAWNGGSAETCALLPGSPAMDTGTSADAPGEDQRGITRPQKDGYDMGAYEASIRKFLVMKTPSPEMFRFSTGAEEFDSGEGTAWGFPEGMPVTVTFLPEAGKTVKDVLVDRQSIGAVRSYTFPNLDRDHEVDVVFMDTPASSGGGCSAIRAGYGAALLILPVLFLGKRR